MTEKPTYEELEQRIKQLEKLENQHKEVEISQYSSAALLQEIANQSGDGISLANTEGNYVFVNPAFCKTTGYSEAELLTMNIRDLVPHETKLELFPRVSNGQSGKRITELMNKNGSRFIAEVAEYPIKLENQRLVLGIIRNISEHLQVEEKLRESEYKHKALIHNIPGMVYRAYADWSAEVISGCEKICGYTHDEINSKEGNWLNVIHPDDKEKVLKEGSDLTKQPQDVVQTYRIIDKNGDIRWVEDRKTSRFSEEGEFKEIDGILFDVTARIQTEEALRGSGETARALLNASTESASLIETDGTFVTMNEVTAERLGKPVETLLGKCSFDFFPPEVAASRRKKIEEVIHRKQPVRYTDKRSGLIFDNNVYPIIGSNGEVARIAVFSSDITQRRRTEEALRESEEKFKLIAENSADTIYKVKLENEQYTYANPLVDKVFGYSVEEILSLKVKDTLTPDSYAKQRERLENALMQGTKDPEILEVDVLHKDGHVIPVEIHATFISNDQGYPMEIIGVARDITERKNAEKALRDSEALFRDLTETTSDWIWKVNSKGIYTYSSPKVLEILGYEPGEVIGKTPVDLMPPDEAKRISNIFNDIVKLRKPFNSLENTCLHKNGYPVVLETSGVPILDAEGAFLGYRGIDRDITNRKKAEEALRENEELLRDLYENAPNAYFSVGIDGRIQRCNQRAGELLGYSTEELVNKSVLEIYADTPYGKEKAIEILQRFRSGEYVLDEELQMQKADGTLIWISLTVNSIRNSEGRVIESRSSVVDISDRKQTEKALRQYADTQAVLLREVNHRVKNNLAAIIGLLLMERNRLKMKEAIASKDVLGDLIRRIEGLSIVHNLLSESNWRPLLLNELCEQVICAALQGVSLNKTVSIDIMPSAIKVESNQSHHLTLVINELVTNTFKHVLSKRDTAQINVEFVLDGEKICIIFKDDGPGYPEEMIEGDFSRISVGFDLILGIVKESLRGEVFLENDNGAVTTIKFKLEKQRGEA